MSKPLFKKIKWLEGLELSCGARGARGAGACPVVPKGLGGVEGWNCPVLPEVLRVYRGGSVWCLVADVFKPTPASK